MKKILFYIAVILHSTIVVCARPEIAIEGGATPVTRALFEKYYLNYTRKGDHKDIDQIEIIKEFLGTLEYYEAKLEEIKEATEIEKAKIRERKAYEVLLPQYLVTIKSHGQAWLWNDIRSFFGYDYKNEEWLRKLNSDDLGSFMSYLYDLNIQSTSRDEIEQLSNKSGVRRLRGDGYDIEIYTLDDQIFRSRREIYR